MRGRYEKKTPSIWSMIYKIVAFLSSLATIIKFIEDHIEG